MVTPRDSGVSDGVLSWRLWWQPVFDGKFIRGRLCRSWLMLTIAKWRDHLAYRNKDILKLWLVAMVNSVLYCSRYGGTRQKYWWENCYAKLQIWIKWIVIKVSYIIYFVLVRHNIISKGIKLKSYVPYVRTQNYVLFVWNIFFRFIYGREGKMKMSFNKNDYK